ncbi:hypothetical protein SERLADRAFT_349889 [Serpula lacrymans var. lacrymans S7.9]|uniref:Uncharacterized protein n=1 Tax=Serpula lacrymans var. lacrymans (strain S7.9) TaxID=578457 RepID=F8P278_SERL9|nr:uncharacterized protein SERLADRAFT_349889 [Serpula lacrymans var. lacrymans S7.9]EGO23256.1 hypothetical protein SERLADRAFT_349889 [Serpula lacrymans var. lacrymans S7.9]
MGKNKKNSVPGEEHLVLPLHPYTEAAATPASITPIVDTHTHLLSTFSAYRQKYKFAKHEDVFAFVKGLYSGRNIEAIIDVWCEAPVQAAWKELADSALTAHDREVKWAGVEYWFVMGKLPVVNLKLHQAKEYNDEVEASILEAMTHPRCVGWGEIGLDYHYDNSPRDIQQTVLIRQLRQAIKLGKPLTIHTREAEEDTERILKQEVPRDHKIHVHCYTDSPELAQRLLEHFPNLHIGVTGVITYSTNLNTSALVRQMSGQPNTLRILLETDAPFMIPSNLYPSLSAVKGRLPLCHTAMIPWVAEYAANVAGGSWDTTKIMHQARENARLVYGI